MKATADVRERASYRLLAGVVHHAGVDIDGLALDLVGPSTVVADAANDGANITAGHVDGLAVVERLDSSEKLGVLLSDVGKLEHQVGTGVWCGVDAPCGVESLASSGDCEIDILLGTLADLGDDLLGGGVNDVELLLVDTLDPLVVDETADRKETSQRQVSAVWKLRNLQANRLLVVASDWRLEGDGESHDGRVWWSSEEGYQMRRR